MSSRVFAHLFRVSLAFEILYSSQRLHMEVNTSRIYHNINSKNTIFRAFLHIQRALYMRRCHVALFTWSNPQKKNKCMF
jgi:hypothetical protein